MRGQGGIFILGGEKIFGMVSWRNNLFPRRLSTEEELKIGHRLLTTGFDGIYPPRILVGEIISIKPTKGLFKKITVRPYFSFYQFDHLAVVLIKAPDFYQELIR